MPVGIVFPGAPVAVDSDDSVESSPQRTETSAFPTAIMLVIAALVIGWLLIRAVVQD